MIFLLPIIKLLIIIMNFQKKLLLFDIDGTLTLPRQKIDKNMLILLQQFHENPTLQQIYDIGFVGGSDLSKQIEQIGKENMYLFHWKFTENGLVSYNHKMEMFHQMFLSSYLGETNLQLLINTCLFVLSQISIPCKRGNFIELRDGLLNISPIGRSCSLLERNEFEVLDKQIGIRQTIIQQIQTNLIGTSLDNQLTFSVGGQISIDIFPKHWNKTYCLQFIENMYESIYFFGDKVEIGGNDYEIYHHPSTISYQVFSPTDTIDILSKDFLNII